MRHEISEDEYTAALDDVLQETFEVFANQKTYLEVLWNEERYVGHVIDFEHHEIHNMSYFFERDDDQYVSEREIAAKRATEKFFAYDSFEDAQAHALEILLTAKN